MRSCSVWVSGASLLLSMLVSSASDLRAETPRDELTRGKALQLLRQAMAASVVDETGRARALASQAARWAKEQQDGFVAAWADQVIGYVEFQAENWEAARSSFESALGGFDRLEKQEQAAVCHANLGRLALRTGDQESAIMHLQPAVAWYAKAKLAAREAATRVDLAEALKSAGRLDEAIGNLTKAMEATADDPAAPPTRLRAALLLGLCHDANGQDQAAVTSLDAAAKWAQELKKDPEAAQVAGTLGIIYQRQGKVEQARGQYEAALELHERLGNQAGAAAVHNNLGALLREAGEFTEAVAHLRQALQIQQKLNDRPAEARVLFNLALALEDSGQQAAAVGTYEQALPIRRKLPDRSSLAKTLEGLGLLLVKQGELDRAKSLLREAETIRSDLPTNNEQ